MDDVGGTRANAVCTQQRACRGIDRFRRTRDLAFKSLAGILRKLEIGAQAGANRVCVNFRRAHVNAQGVRLRQIEKLLR